MSTQTRTSSLRAVRPLPKAADIHLFDHLVGRHLQTLGHAESKHLGTERLITSSILVGCSTGRSAGLAPLRTIEATRGRVLNPDRILSVAWVNSFFALAREVQE
jgi:hypothetical protein